MSTMRPAHATLAAYLLLSVLSVLSVLSASPALSALSAPVALSNPAAPSPPDAQGSWQQLIDPSEAGFDIAKLEEARKLSASAGTAAFMALHKGRVVVAWGNVKHPYKLHSVRKSLLSALLGLALEDGKLGLQTTLADLGIGENVELTETEKSARVLDLMSSRSGIYLPAAYEPAGNRRNRPERSSAVPGERWWYNNWDFNALSTIYQQTVGQTVFASFQQLLAEPLGMEDFDLKRDTFFHYERSSRHPAYLFRLSARDLARFGQLFLRGGTWDATQILPWSWTRLSTTPLTGEVRGSSSYGLMWWVEAPGTFASRPDLSSYSARGTGGQALIVVPGVNMVFVHRGDTDQGRDVSGSAVWKIVDTIIAALGPGSENPSLGPLQASPYPDAPPPLPLPLPRFTEMSRLQLTEFAGQYQVAPGVVTVLEVADGALVGSLPGRGEATFFPTGTTSFASRAFPVRLDFELVEGTANSVLIQMEGQLIRANRLPEANE